MHLLKLKKYLMPIVDVATRRCSTYDMLARLLELESFIDEFSDMIGKDLQLSPNSWIKLKEIKSILESPKKATLLLQAENLTQGDFYKT